jgi:hypothetical protein
MFNSKWAILLGIFISFAGFNVFAQTGFFQGSAQSNAPKKNNNVMSPSDFKSKVQSLGQQNNQQVQQKIDQAFSKIKPAVPSSKSGTQPSEQPNQDATMNPSGALGKEENTPAVSTPSSQIATPSTQAPPSSTTGATPVAPQSQQPYSGFQGNTGTNSNSTTTTSPQPSSGSGWNIKY